MRLGGSWYALDTMRRALRTPGVWALLAIGALSGWGALELAVLALGDAKGQAPGIIAGTGHAFGVLVALWVLARTLGDDRTSNLCVAADCTAPGAIGRLAGRWGGAVATGFLVGIALETLLALATTTNPGTGSGLTSLSLYLTTFEVVLLAGAWGLLFAVVWPNGPIVLLGLIAWFLGHLPWGTPALLEGRWGGGLGFLLPGPRAIETLAQHLPATLLAAAGILILTLAWGGRARART